jgi:serine/threonine-protein kinase RsbW
MPKVVIHASFKNFNKIRDMVDRTGRDAGLSDKEIYKVQLAVDEACSNIVEHGYGGEGKGDIECICVDVGDGLKIVIRDWGPAFDPNGVPEPNLTESVQDVKLRGAGIFLIRSMMDEFDFVSSPKSGNTLTFVKRKSSDSPPH